MHVTGPPSDPRHGASLHLVRAARRTFAGAAEYLVDPDHRADVGRYLSDLLRPYGLDPHGDFLDGARLGHSYGEMAEALIREVVRPDEPVDVLILAFAVPDMRPGRSAAAYLSHVCPGSPQAFAVYDQGAATAFTGLRLAREFLAGGGCRRALLIVVEQAAMHYAIPADAATPVPARHAGVALLCADTAAVSAPRLTDVRQHADVPPDRVEAILKEELTRQAMDGRRLTVVPGAGLPQLGLEQWGGRVRPPPAGQPYTGVWWELADVVAAGDEAEWLMLVDYDAALRYLSLSTVDRTAHLRRVR
jgi:hypothetical protein